MPHAPNPHNQALGQRLRLLRTQLGLTQAAFAKQLGMTQPALSLVENGSTSPSLELLRQIHQLTGQPYTYLLEGRLPDASGGQLLHERLGLAPLPQSVQSERLVHHHPIVEQEQLREQLRLPSTPPPALPLLHYPGLERGLVLQLSSSAMAPTLVPGDLLLCTPQPSGTPPKPNYIYLVLQASPEPAARVRRLLSTELGMLLLKADNPAYTSQNLPQEQAKALYRVRKRITGQMSGPLEVHDRLNRLEQQVSRLEARLNQQETKAD